MVIYPLDRTNALDVGNTNAPGSQGYSFKQNGAARPKHKMAGAPGYLMQSDILQQLGSSLTARSDTFKIRSAGRSDDGAVAYVEMVVQRSARPITPDPNTILD